MKRITWFTLAVTMLPGPQAFGGFVGFGQPKLYASEFEIETVHKGEAVERLQIIL
jgi:hypothetical protein